MALPLVCLALAGTLSTLAWAGPYCETPTVATTISRTTTTCQPLGGTWLKRCDDESWKNGGCAEPKDKSVTCTEGPMTTKVKIRIYNPVDSGGGCACEYDHEETPDGQVKGIAGGDCTKTPTGGDPGGGGNP